MPPEELIIALLDCLSISRWRASRVLLWHTVERERPSQFLQRALLGKQLKQAHQQLLEPLRHRSHVPDARPHMVGLACPGPRESSKPPAREIAVIGGPLALVPALVVPPTPSPRESCAPAHFLLRSDNMRHTRGFETGGRPLGGDDDLLNVQPHHTHTHTHT